MKNSKTKKIAVTVAAVIGAAAVLVLAFFAGYVVRDAVSGDAADWVLSIIEKYYYQDIDSSEADNIAADAIVDKYLDIYSEYYTAEEYRALQASNGGSSSGVGISYAYIPGTGVTVIGTTGNSPSFRAGLRSGDVILYAEKEGERTYFNSSSDFSAFISELDAGEDATYFTASGETFTFAKEAYSVSYVLLATNDGAWTFTFDDENNMSMVESEGDEIDYLPDGCAYIYLSQFYGKAVEQFEMAAAKMNELGCTSLILDLRNDGGGYVSVMQGISGCFEASAGQLAMEARSGNGSVVEYMAGTADEESILSADTEVYVLANGNTASASEALIGVLISYGIAGYEDIYVSEYSEEYLSAFGVTAESVKSGRTYGKGIMQSTYKNPLTQDALKLTTHQIYWPDGHTIHDVGLSANDGCHTVDAPAPLSGDGEELRLAVQAIFG